MNNIGITLTADNRAMLRALKEADAALGNSKRAASGSMDGIAKAAASAQAAVARLAVGFAGFASVRQFVQAADSVTSLGNRLKLASKDAAEAKSAFDGLFSVAQRSRVGFVELGETYAAMARNTQHLGISQSRLLTVTEAIGSAMAVSGGSAQSMQAALVQLGQGLASGQLRGEELNSVMEQTPRLAKALADGLGISIGALRDVAKNGELTSEVVIKALESQYEVLRKEVAESTMTVGQSMTTLGNSFVYAAGQIDEATGATGTMAQMITALGRGVDDVGEALRAMAEQTKSTKGEFGEFSVISDTVRVAFEAAAVLFLNVKFVIQELGRELGKTGAQLAALATLNFSGFSEIARAAAEDSANARAELDRLSAAILNAKKMQDIAATGVGQDEPRFARLLEGHNRVQRVVTQNAQLTEKQQRELDKKRQAAAKKEAEYQAMLIEFDQAQFNAHMKRLEATEKQQQISQESLVNLEFETQLLGLGNEERERAVFLRDLENKGILEGTEAYEKIIKAREAYEQKSKQVEHVEKEKKAYEDMWKSVDREAERIFIDIAQNGDDAFKRIGKSIEEYLLKMLYEMTVKQWIIQVVGGPAGGAMGGAGGNMLSSFGSSALGGINVGGASLGAIGSSVSTGFTTTMMGGSVAPASAAYSSAGMGGVSTGLNVGAAGAYAAGALGGMYANRKLSGGYELDNKHSQTIQDMAVVAATAFFGPLGGIAAGVGAAVVNRAFGRKLTESGIMGTFSGGQIDSSRYQFEKGGWLRSNKTTTSDLDEPARRAMNAQLKAIQDSAAGMAKALGHSAESIENYTGRVRINLKGLNQEEAAKKMAKEMEKLKIEMLSTIPGINMTKEQLKGLIKEVQEMMTAAGISVDGMAQIITQGMLGRLSEEQVGEQLAEMVIGGIYNTMVSPFATEISTIFSSQILEPMFTAIAAGVPISQAISQASIDAVVQKANQAAQAIGAVMADPGFRAAIASVQSAISGIARASTRVNVPSYGQANSQALAQRVSLENKLLSLQGRTNELRARELASIDARNRSLQQSVWRLEDARTQLDNAFAALEQAINTSLTAARDSESSLKSIFDLLRTNIRELRGEVESTSEMQFKEAQKVISQAIAANQVLDLDVLEKSISALRKGLDDTVYISRIDRDRAKLLLANDLQALQNIVEPKLSEAERSILLLEEQLEIAKRQYNALLDIDDSIKDLSGSMAAFAAAMANYSAASSAASAAFANAAAIKPTPAPSAPRVWTVQGYWDNNPDIRDWYNKNTRLANHMYGSRDGYLRDHWQRFGINENRKFAKGGFHMGGVRLVGEQGPELEFTGPSRIYSAQKTKAMLAGGGDGMIAELQALRQDMAMLRAEARATAINTGRQADLMKRVTRNGEAMTVMTDGDPLEVTS